MFTESQKKQFYQSRKKLYKKIHDQEEFLKTIDKILKLMFTLNHKEFFEGSKTGNLQDRYKKFFTLLMGVNSVAKFPTCLNNFIKEFDKDDTEKENTQKCLSLATALAQNEDFIQHVIHAQLIDVTKEQAKKSEKKNYTDSLAQCEAAIQESLNKHVFKNKKINEKQVPQLLPPILKIAGYNKESEIEKGKELALKQIRGGRNSKEKRNKMTQWLAGEILKNDVKINNVLDAKKLASTFKEDAKELASMFKEKVAVAIQQIREQKKAGQKAMEFDLAGVFQKSFDSLFKQSSDDNSSQAYQAVHKQIVLQTIVSNPQHYIPGVKDIKEKQFKTINKEYKKNWQKQFKQEDENNFKNGDETNKGILLAFCKEIITKEEVLDNMLRCTSSIPSTINDDQDDSSERSEDALQVVANELDILQENLQPALEEKPEPALKLKQTNSDSDNEVADELKEKFQRLSSLSPEVTPSVTSQQPLNGAGAILFSDNANHRSQQPGDISSGPLQNIAEVIKNLEAIASNPDDTNKFLNKHKVINNQAKEYSTKFITPTNKNPALLVYAVPRGEERKPENVVADIQINKRRNIATCHLRDKADKGDVEASILLYKNMIMRSDASAFDACDYPLKICKPDKAIQIAIAAKAHGFAPSCKPQILNKIQSSEETTLLKQILTMNSDEASQLLAYIDSKNNFDYKNTNSLQELSQECNKIAQQNQDSTVSFSVNIPTARSNTL